MGHFPSGKRRGQVQLASLAQRKLSTSVRSENWTKARAVCSPCDENADLQEKRGEGREKDDN